MVKLFNWSQNKCYLNFPCTVRMQFMSGLMKFFSISLDVLYCGADKGIGNRRTYDRFERYLGTRLPWYMQLLCILLNMI